MNIEEMLKEVKKIPPPRDAMCVLMSGAVFKYFESESIVERRTSYVPGKTEVQRGRVGNFYGLPAYVDDELCCKAGRAYIVVEHIKYIEYLRFLETVKQGGSSYADN